MNKAYSFRLLLDDADLREKLNSMTGNERSSYIRSALRFYFEFGEGLSKIAKDIEQIKQATKSKGVLDSEGDSQEDRQPNKLDETDKIILESIQDILNM